MNGKRTMKEILFQIFLFRKRSGDFVAYLDETREKLMDEPIAMEGEKNDMPIEICDAVQYILC